MSGHTWKTVKVVVEIPARNLTEKRFAWHVQQALQNGALEHQLTKHQTDIPREHRVEIGRPIVKMFSRVMAWERKKDPAA